MELYQLRYFLAVAQLGNFSRAAEHCSVTQPSLSQQIANLEAEVGKRLFDRLGRRVQLTEAGRFLLDRAAAIVAAEEDARRCLREDDGLDRAQLAVGAIPTIAPYLLPQALDRFIRRYPGVELTVHEDGTHSLIEAMVLGELDLAVVALPIADQRLQTQALWSEPLWLTVPQGHRLAGKKRVSVTDLQDERFILLTEMHCLGDQIMSFCRAHDCQPRIACRSAQLSTVQALIALGQGVSLLPEMARRADDDPRRVYLPLSGHVPMRAVGAMGHRHRSPSLAGDRFLQVLRELGQAQTHPGAAVD
jgi:LysR family hydrogen peroxide-inducible transcriptional activator